MPQRKNVTLIPLTVATIEESIRRAWEDKKPQAADLHV